MGYVFMMLMVIPVSKMISSIFMKLIARMGTIDEENTQLWAWGQLWQLPRLRVWVKTSRDF
jgi:hypothetical protein